MDTRSQLHSITNSILDTPGNDYATLYGACDDLYQLLIRISDTEFSAGNSPDQILTEHGKAIGITWAAMCVKDLARTKKFMDGVYAAVNDSLEKIKDRPVHILYAGTGPFAALVLPLFSRFTPSQIQCTLLEVNKQSFLCLERLLNLVDLRPFVHHMEQADATQWKRTSTEPIDIFVTETMNSGLTKEPQVAIAINILPQLPEHTIMIPQSIQLRAALIHLGKRDQYKMGLSEADDSIDDLGVVLDFNKQAALRHGELSNRPGYQFPGLTTTVPDSKIGWELSILTTVTVYGMIQLRLDESPLTLPLKLTTITDKAPKELELVYKMGPQPGVQFHSIS